MAGNIAGAVAVVAAVVWRRWRKEVSVGREWVNVFDGTAKIGGRNLVRE